MAPIHALILGLIQGVTEFFPISSSAHLAIAKKIFGIETISPHFDLACHLGTLVALTFFFRHDIRALFTEERRKIPLFVLALVPLVPIYLLGKGLRSGMGLKITGLFLIVTAVFLYLGQKWQLSFKKKRPMRDALVIGVMQGAALFPGISRSGATISCAKVLGWTTSEAIRFSFLLSIPTILGGAILESSHVTELFTQASFIGFSTSLLSGLFTAKIALTFLEKGRFTPFSIYCLMMGGACLWL